MSKVLEPIVVPQNLKPHPLYYKVSKLLGFLFLLWIPGLLLFFFDFPYRWLVQVCCLASCPLLVFPIQYFMFDKPVKNPLFKYVYGILDNRPGLSDSEYTALWGDEKKADIARQVTVICREETGSWEKEHYFIPEDSFAIMIELITGDLCEVCCVMGIEEEFGVKFDDDSPFIDMTLADVVEYIISQKGKTC